MSSTNDKTCKECGDTLTEIRLIDHGHAGAHFDMEYTLPGAKRGFLGRFAVEGKVGAVICPTCGQISLFGIPQNNG